MSNSTLIEPSSGHDDRYDRLASLTRRLVDGESRIEAAAARGEDISSWEEFWLRLLREYEALHNEIAEERQRQHASIAA